MKPRLFIGSSIESLSVAYAVQENFEHDAEVTVWPEGIFEPSKSVLHQLLAVLDTFDFAVFVFAPDDIGIIRDRAQPITRDNVIFELGLFIARLGPERCFFLVPRGTPDLRLPSNLLGVTPAIYDNERQDKNIVAGLGAPCNKIRRVMGQMGRITKDAAREKATAQITAGLAEEIRDAMRAWLIMQCNGEPTQKMLDELEHVVEGVMSSQGNAGIVRNSNEILLRVAALDEISLEVARSLRNGHLTRTQYKALLEHPVAGRAVLHLRQAGLLVPLVGYEKGKRAPVYWFPPTTSKKIFSALSIPAKSNAAVVEEVRHALVGSRPKGSHARLYSKAHKKRPLQRNTRSVHR